MALKFTEKLKGIDLGKGKESLSEVASSVSKLFDRKNRGSTISNVKENIYVEYELGNILEPTTLNIVKEESEHILYQKVSPDIIIGLVIVMMLSPLQQYKKNILLNHTRTYGTDPKTTIETIWSCR